MMRNYIWIWICFVSVVCFPSNDEIPIEGTVADGWEFVRDLFKENFIEKRDLGGSISVYHQGKLVVDLSAGWFDDSMNKFYDRDTLQLVFSTTKGIVAIAVALCVEKGLLDYSELVSTYWPEYAQNGKENTTVADIVSHRAGLPLNPLLSEYLLNWTAMIEFLETEKPLWNPGNAHSYHALTYGYLAGELIHRVDPKKRTIGQFIRDEIVNPLNVQFYVGLPKEEEYRVSPLTFDSNTLEIFNETQQAVYLYFNDPLVHQAQIPAANGITNARSLAKIYAALITNLENNEKPLLNRNILEQAIQSNTPHNELDILTNSSSTFAMGFLLFDKIFPFFNSTVFGHPGAGGSIALAVPSKNLSFAYVMNQLDFSSNDQIYPRFYRILKKISMKIDNLD